MALRSLKDALPDSQNFVIKSKVYDIITEMEQNSKHYTGIKLVLHKHQSLWFHIIHQANITEQYNHETTPCTMSFSLKLDISCKLNGSLNFYQQLAILSLLLDLLNEFGAKKPVLTDVQPSF